MPRPSGDSKYRAPFLWPDALVASDNDTFERELLGFCVSALLDQRTSYAESRSKWAERLNLSKSHVTKMTDTPTPSFIEQFDLVLSELTPASPIDEAKGPTSERLNPLMSEFYSDLRPSYRVADRTSSVLRWFARYRPNVSDQVKMVLYESAVAEERCRMLERGGYADHDEMVRTSIRKLLLVVSGPFGASAIAHRECAELGLHVPIAFFDEIQEMLNSSPVGFRGVRTLARFVRLWHAHAGASLQYPQLVEAQLIQLLGKMPLAHTKNSFVDPYPGAEWTLGLAKECLQFRNHWTDDLDPANVLVADTMSWLHRTYQDTGASERARLHAAWLAVSHAETDAARDEVVELLASESPGYLKRWAPLLARANELLATPPSAPPRDVEPDLDVKERLDAFDAEVSAEFAPEIELISEVVLSQTTEERYRGVRGALASVVTSALLTPDGHVRRAMIEAIANAGMVGPTADVLAILLGIKPSREAGDRILEDPALVETAIFLHGRLRKAEGEGRIAWLLEQATNGQTSLQVRHAAIWSIGDVWTRGLPAGEVVRELASLATEATLPLQIRMSATHVLAVIAHQQAHRGKGEELRDGEDATEALRAVSAAYEPGRLDGRELIRAMCYWATKFDPRSELDSANVSTLSGVLDAAVGERFPLDL